MKFLARDTSDVEKLPSSTLHRSARFSQSTTSASVQIEVEAPKIQNHRHVEQVMSESCNSSGTRGQARALSLIRNALATLQSVHLLK